MKKTFASISLTLLIVLLGTASVPRLSHAAGLVPCGHHGDATERNYNPETGIVECDFTYFMQMLNGVISFLLFSLAMPLAALMFAYAGFLYLTSGVKPEQREKAKKLLGNIIWGLVIALAAWLIVHTVLTSLNVNEASIFLDNPADTPPPGGAAPGAGAAGGGGL